MFPHTRSDLKQMVTFTFTHLSTLCSPARDAQIAARRSDLDALLTRPSLRFPEFVIPFLKAFHLTVDDIEGDMAAFREHVRSGGNTPSAIPTSPGASRGEGTPARVPSSPGLAGDEASPGGGGIRHVKAMLRQLGVDEGKIADCVERSELDALLHTALGRATGTVSGGITHASLINVGSLLARMSPWLMSVPSYSRPAPCRCGRSLMTG